MKNVSLGLLLLFVGSLLSQAQDTLPSVVLVSTQGTSTLVFPAAIVEVDRGNRAVVAKRVAGKPYLLWIKAVSDQFPPTNISVITEDQRLYVLSLAYARQPNSWVVQVDTTQAFGTASKPLDDQRVAAKAVSSFKKADNRRRVRPIRQTKKNGLQLQLVYWRSDGQTYVLELALTNRSSVLYKSGAVNGWLKTSNAKRRGATQKLAISNPVQVPQHFTLDQHQTQSIQITLPFFWLSNHQQGELWLLDNRGERVIGLVLKERHLRRIQSTH